MFRADLFTNRASYMCRSTLSIDSYLYCFAITDGSSKEEQAVPVEANRQ